MKLSARVIVELVGGLVALCSAFALYFLGVTDRLWIGVFLGIGCVLMGAAALTLSQQQEQ